MSPLDGDLLRLLSHMPLLDRMEMAALSGWSGGGVYRAVSRLEDAGLIASVPHGTELIPPTRRFHLTAAGLRRLARAENAAPESGTGQALEGLLRDLPVSAAGGAFSWNASTPWPSSTASPPPYRTRPFPSASSGIAPCRWTPP